MKFVKYILTKKIIKNIEIIGYEEIISYVIRKLKQVDKGKCE